MNNKKFKNGNKKYGISVAVFIFCISLLLASCEKEVHINLSNGTPQLVVQGAIETNLPPYVVLTKSIGYSPTVDLSTLENNYVHNAIVKISDGSQTITLKEYLIDSTVNKTNYKFYVYTIDSSDPASFYFTGKIEHCYTLSISSEGKDYSSVTKIPNPKPLDSLWAEKPDSNTAQKVPLARIVWFRYTDPDTAGNNFRYFTQTDNGPYYPWVNSVFNDQIINGTTITYRLDIGYDHSKNPNLDSVGKAYVGDTITIKWCAIDKGVYDFYNTLEYSTGTVGSPFVSPINVKTNITGGALGIWAGYGSTFKTIIISE